MTDAFTKRQEGAPRSFFAVEAAGLDWLRSASPGGPAVPRVLDVDDDHITIERVDVGPWTAAADERFGRALAALHLAGAPSFGWPDHPTGYIGPLSQSNAPSDEWPTFYAEQRVRPFARAAFDSGALDAAGRAAVDDVCARITELAGAAEPPARIHGDLWRGNVLGDRDGETWVIDPAAHGGHRETDLAMMRLFGGFGERCFDAYAEAYPLRDGWRDRIPLHQLHPLLVHAVLFGGGYGAEARAAARRALHT